MIDWIITNETGKDKEYFESHPTSKRKVYRICNQCCEGSWVRYCDSHKLCRSCSVRKCSL